MAQLKCSPASSPLGMTRIFRTPARGRAMLAVVASFLAELDHYEPGGLVVVGGNADKRQPAHGKIDVTPAWPSCCRSEASRGFGEVPSNQLRSIDAPASRPRLAAPRRAERPSNVPAILPYSGRRPLRPPWSALACIDDTLR